MKAFFEGIQWFFDNIFFVIHDFLRELEPKSWFAANILNWVFMIICASAMVYWIRQLKSHEQNGEENQDTSAHSFLTK